MKNTILIFCSVLVAFSLTAFAYMNWTDTTTDEGKSTTAKTSVLENYLVNTMNYKVVPDLVYIVDSRYARTITKENLHKANSIVDVFPKKATQSVESYQVVEVVIVDSEKNISERGDSGVFNAAQRKLLQSSDYSTNLYISTNCKSKYAGNGEMREDSLVYWMTIVPEKEAEFRAGHDALIEYLKENSKEFVAIIKQDKLRPGRVSFTITKIGTVANVKLTSTSGYPSVDTELVEMITNMPGEWNPAKNTQGEKVEQELIFFFGQAGC